MPTLPGGKSSHLDKRYYWWRRRLKGKNYRNFPVNPRQNVALRRPTPWSTPAPVHFSHLRSRVSSRTLYVLVDRWEVANTLLKLYSVRDHAGRRRASGSSDRQFSGSESVNRTDFLVY